jgi:hypothetical protein
VVFAGGGRASRAFWAEVKSLGQSGVDSVMIVCGCRVLVLVVKLDLLLSPASLVPFLATDFSNLQALSSLNIVSNSTSLCLSGSSLDHLCLSDPHESRGAPPHDASPTWR